AKAKGDDTAFLLLYVDDIVLTASSDCLLHQIIASLHREFSMTDLEILKRAHMVGCNPSWTPIDTESKLGDGGTLVCLYMYDPREPYFSALKRILRYVHGTLDYGLQLFSSTIDSLIAYSDADWTGFLTMRPSTLGYCIFLGNNLLSWSSKRQLTLSRSSVKAEYHGVANAVAETCWIWNLLRKLHTPLSSAIIVYCDNVRVLHVPSRFQYANIFTKGLPLTLFDEFRDSLSVRCTPALIAGGIRELIEETLRVKSSGFAGGKNKRISIGIKTSGKSSGEEVNIVPNYLKASTGSCHDIYKYGKRYEHLNSAILIKFDKEKVAKTIVPVEKKKTTTVKPSPVTVNRDVSARSNARVKKKEIKTVEKVEATRKTCPAKKLIPKATLTDLRSQKASLSRAESLKATKSKSAKNVAPLKDQNWMQKSEPEQTSSNKIEALDGFKTEPEVRLKTMEFDFILPSMELVDPPVYNESEPFTCNDIGKEESLIMYIVNERFKPIPDEELPKNSTIVPMVIESSHASLNKEVSEESLIAPPVSKSTQDEGVLEDESEYTDDHNKEVEVLEDSEKEIAVAQNDEMETTARVQDKV
nr:ribonuclease H-like domain-containing protein [Tanacetum cinerariifolium]